MQLHQQDRADEAEQARRRQFNRDSLVACRLGLTLDETVAKKQVLATEWAGIIYREMDTLRALDPIEVLPQILATFELRAEACARKVAREQDEKTREWLRKAVAK